MGCGAQGAAALQLLPERTPGPAVRAALDRDGMEEGAETTSLSHTTGSEFKDEFAPLCCDIEACWDDSGPNLSFPSFCPYRRFLQSDS